jgi:hypothetical protein
MLKRSYRPKFLDYYREARSTMGRKVPRYVKQLKRPLKAGQLPTVQPGTVSLVDVVCPENSKLLKSLTFSSIVFTLDQHTFAPSKSLWEVSDDTTHRLCPDSLRRHTVPVTCLAAPGTPGAAAPARRLQTSRPPPSTASE